VDGALLALLSLVVVLPYVFRLGLISDDWDFVGFMQGAGGFTDSLRVLWDEFPYLQNRPLYLVYLAGMYELFGKDVLWPSLINVAVSAAGAILFYSILRKIGLPRLFALTTPMVFLVLPHYSTDRMWLTAYFITISTTLAFFSLFADLKAVEAAETARRVKWKLAAVIAIVLSAMLYELALPVLLAGGLLFLLRAYQLRRDDGRGPGVTRFAIVSGAINVALILVILAVKAITTVRSHNPDDIISTGVRLAGRAFLNGYSRNLAELPDTLLRSVTDYRSEGAIIAGLAAAVLAYLALVRIPSVRLDFRTAFVAVCAGVFISLFCYTVFLTLTTIPFMKAGVLTRFTIVAAAGVAIVCVAGLLFVTSGLKPRLRGQTVAVAIALLVFTSVTVNGTIGNFWAEASDQQEAVLAELAPHVQDLPPNSNVLLDGMCRWHGPTPVFETWWDVTGRLKILTGDPTIRGDVIWPNLQLTDAGLKRLRGEGTEEESYYDAWVYEPGSTYVYRVDTNTWLPIETYDQLVAYLETSPNRNTPCEGFDGQGQTIFPNVY
jgi:hypothetical protein